MGRAPCCDKASVKKGPWSPEEDAALKSYIELNGTGGNWIALPQKIGLNRCGKSCRLRWLNYLRPDIRHGGFTEEEDHVICSLYLSIGSRWSVIAAQLQGRTDNDIKNYWNTKLKKKLLGRQLKERDRMYNDAKGLVPLIGATNQIMYWQNQPFLSIPQQENHQKPNDEKVGNHMKIDGREFQQELNPFLVPFQQPPCEGMVTFDAPISATSLSNSVCSSTNSSLPNSRNIPESTDDEDMLRQLAHLFDVAHSEIPEAETANHFSNSKETTFSTDQSNSCDDTTSLVFGNLDHQNDSSWMQDYLIQSYLSSTKSMHGFTV